MFRCLARLGVMVMGVAIVACWGCGERPAKKAEPGAKQGQPPAPKPEAEQPAKPAAQETKPAEKKPEEPAPAEAAPTSGRGGRAVGRVLRRLIEGSEGSDRPAPLFNRWSVPRRIMPPAIDAKEAGKKALAEYDLDGDGAIGAQELDKAPSLKAAIKNLDRNDDGKVTAEEVTARIKAWQKTKVGLISFACTVTLDGQPLGGATVTFAPEKFLGTQIKPATGVTDRNGIANVTIQVERGEPGGMACGLYRVQISRNTGGKEVIPARYNTQTTLGLEVALDAEGMQEGILRFDLRSQ